MELETLQNNVVAVIAIAALAGLFIGWLITYLFVGRGPSKTELTGKLEAVEEEFETHKTNVDQHFAKTSELVNELTESYVKVYKHLSDGAEQLGGVVDMRNRLTLDKNDASTAGQDDEKVIEGALAATAGVAGAAGAVALAEDPEFTVSDEAVAETLTEIEQAEPLEADAEPEASAKDASAKDASAKNTGTA